MVLSYPVLPCLHTLSLKCEVNLGFPRQAYSPGGFGRRRFGFGCRRGPLRGGPAAGAAPHGHRIPVAIPTVRHFTSSNSHRKKISETLTEAQKPFFSQHFCVLGLLFDCIMRLLFVAPSAQALDVDPFELDLFLLMQSGGSSRLLRNLRENKRSFFSILRIKESHLPLLTILQRHVMVQLLSIYLLNQTQIVLGKSLSF